jgi:RimJ/RimL family protein N-acetyltransferase
MPQNSRSKNNYRSPFIKGEKIDLIPANKEFIILFKKWINDPDSRKYMRNEIPITLEELKKHADEENERIKTGISLILFHKEDKKAIGIGGFSSIDWINRNANIFLNIGEKNYWGRGIATEVIMLLIRYGFEELNFHKIYAQIFTPNTASWKCAEKCGFRYEGTLKDEAFVDGEYLSSKNYGLLKREWEEKDLS